MKKVDRMFRQHWDAPEGITSPLYRQLTQEWARLHDTPSTTLSVRRWGRIEPALAGYHQPGQIVDAIDAADHDRTNELLLALTRLFQSGHHLAGRIVLQALLPKLSKLAEHADGMCTASRETWDEDRRHITIAEFWDVMAHYPVERRTRAVAANLAFETLHRITGARKPPPEIPVDFHADPVESASLVAIDSDPFNEITTDDDLLHIITWGIQREVITSAEAQLLITVYSTQKGAGFGFTIAAEQLDLSAAAVRQRCSRTTRKLAGAVRAELNTTVLATA